MIVQHPSKNYKITAVIQTNMWRKQLLNLLDVLGFSMIQLEEDGENGNEHN